MNNSRVLRAALSTLFLLPAIAGATNGYFVHGVGTASRSLAGVGIALPLDGLAAGNNPAGVSFVDDRADVGLSWFRPERGAEIVGNLAGANGQYDGSGKKDFFVPELGLIKHFAPALTGSLAIYGNGGMNTQYAQNPFGAFGSKGQAGVDLSQLFIAPTIAYKVTDTQSIGASVVFAYQRFKAEGLSAFDNPYFTASPGHVTDQGYDSSTGWGVRLGWTGRIAPTLTLGATWASKIRTGEFDKYRGLFAESGGFDIPSNYGLGLAWAANDALTLAADWQRIAYSEIKSVGNPLAKLNAGNPLGSADGPGFGWKDISVYKLGASYTLNPAVTLRAGYSHADQPIPADQTLLNIVAPGVVQDHLSLGATWRVSPAGDLSLGFTHGLKQTVNGSRSIPPAFGGGEANIHLQENIFDIAYGWRF
ncbi:OmpP1/FadL family transporter [Niveibacterium sp.]|uniref:OmpP1/FadL family transporter n=1 Tax=Niveibacterium sp. TaxID=2017444 RepID=UPI0035AE70C6